MSQVIQFKLYAVGRTQIFSVAFHTHNMREEAANGAPRRPTPAVSNHYYATVENAGGNLAVEFMDLVLANVRAL